jgi:hypothetical protein
MEAMSPQGTDYVTRDHLDLRLSEMESRMMDRLTWRMVTILGAWTAIAASVFTVLGRTIH